MPAYGPCNPGIGSNIPGRLMQRVTLFDPAERQQRPGGGQQPDRTPRHISIGKDHPAGMLEFIYMIY